MTMLASPFPTRWHKLSGADLSLDLSSHYDSLPPAEGHSLSGGVALEIAKGADYAFIPEPTTNTSYICRLSVVYQAFCRETDVSQ